jgi:hypothetical protein
MSTISVNEPWHSTLDHMRPLYSVLLMYPWLCSYYKVSDAEEVAIPTSAFRFGSMGGGSFSFVVPRKGDINATPKIG